jgi:hypothetical protein
LKSAFFQFVIENDLIDAFEQSGTEALMNVICGVDDVFGDLVFGHGFEKGNVREIHAKARRRKG